MNKVIAVGTLFIGGIVGVVANIIIAGNAIPNDLNIDKWMLLVTSSGFLALYISYILLAYLLPLLGFVYLHEVFQNRTSKIALIFSIIGTVVVLPTMGVIAYISPSVDTQNQEIMIGFLQDAILNRAMFLNIFGAICYTVGTSIFGYMFFKKGYKLLSISLILHGLFLSFGFGFYPILIIGWSLLLVVALYAGRFENSELSQNS